MQLLQQSSEKMKKKKVITRRGYTTSPIRKRKAKKKKNKTEEVKQKYVTLATWQGRQIPTAWPILTLHLCGSAALSPCCHSNITMAMLFINVSYACISLWLWLLEVQLEQIPVCSSLCTNPMLSDATTGVWMCALDRKHSENSPAWGCVKRFECSERVD